MGHSPLRSAQTWAGFYKGQDPFKGCNVVITLKAGTLLYHGTDQSNFDEQSDGLEGPAWLSNSVSVARFFATRNAGGGGPTRIITYRLTADLKLHEIHTRDELETLAEEFGIDLEGTEAIRDSVYASGIPGWVIVGNYPEGDDILIANTSALEYVVSTAC